MKKITGGKKCSWLAKGQVIASFEIPKIQAAESQLYPLFILFYFLLQILLPIIRALYWLPHFI